MQPECLTAYFSLTSQIQQKQAVCLYTYALMCLDNATSEIDSSQAIKLLLNLANKNNYELAQALLGLMYLCGYQVAQDSTLAEYWLQRAANNNSIVAKRILPLLPQEDLVARHGGLY